MLCMVVGTYISLVACVFERADLCMFCVSIAAFAETQEPARHHVMHCGCSISGLRGTLRLVQLPCFTVIR